LPGWFRFGVGRWRIRVHVMLGLFMGFADGFAPSVGAVGVDVFVLGKVEGLDQGLA
jgi:hypothetical protein